MNMRWGKSVKETDVTEDMKGLATGCTEWAGGTDRQSATQN
jgi:hypothetical protein